MTNRPVRYGLLLLLLSAAQSICTAQLNDDLRGRVKFPIGGTAHERAEKRA